MRSELDAAKRFLRRQLPDGGRVLCAVSGGLDSMVLLALLLSWGPSAGLRIAAAHFHHGLRGAEADRDQRFVEDYCRERGVPCFTGHGDVRAFARREGLSLEEAGRRLRYAFLQGTAREAGCTAILTAHHADDNAETMLLNLIRGTGSAGLAGIPQVRGNILRPLLHIPRAALEVWAQEHGVPHVEDATNEDPGAADRNAIRHRVLPVLRELNPRAVEHMARTGAILAAESAAIEAQAADLLARAVTDDRRTTIPCAVLTGAPEAVARRAALLLLAGAAGRRQDLGAAHAEALLETALGSDGAVRQLPYGLDVRREGEMLTIVHRESAPSGAVLAPEQTVPFGLFRLTLHTAPVPGAIALAACGKPVGVTAWDRSDRLTLPGARGARSLKRLLAERGIGPALRERLPVVRIGGTAAHVPGVGTDAAFLPHGAEGTIYLSIEEKPHQKTEE